MGNGKFQHEPKGMYKYLYEIIKHILKNNVLRVVGQFSWEKKNKQNKT